MGPRLVGLAALLARKQGPAVAQALLRNGRAWMEDPANDATKRALVGQLRSVAEVAGGAAGALSAKLAREVERRKVTVAAWERDLMALRYEVADMAPGPVRDAALSAYAAQASAGVHLIAGARDPVQARRDVLAALAAEEHMLRGERLSETERAGAVAAIVRARQACMAGM